MALRYQTESPRKALPGQMLLVIHDFEARSPDELSLSKGDRIDLIERDDDFGDGWYLGRHVLNGKTGLFPEVYTTTVPRAATSFTSSSSSSMSGMITKSIIGQMVESPVATRSGADTSSVSSMSALSTSNPPSRTPKAGKTQSLNDTKRSTPPALYTSSNPPSSAAAVPAVKSPSTPSGQASQRSLSLGPMADQHADEADSPVINETLSVIDEHITDMSTPRHSITAIEGRMANDSGSEYSSHLDPRLSYITGHETDEEEEGTHTEAEVLRWSPAQVSDFLRVVGVEKSHCDVFRDQEISGEVLLGMDQASLLIKELDLGPVGRRLRTWQKIKALQDEFKAAKHSRQSSANFAGNNGSLDDLTRSRGSTIGAVLPRIPSLLDNPTSQSQNRSSRQVQPRLQQQQQQQQQEPQQQQKQQQKQQQQQEQQQQQRQQKPLRLSSMKASLEAPPSPVPSNSGQNSPRRPSAASVRELHHSRRHSSIDVSREGLGLGAPNSTSSMPHKKQPSFDRNWTMGTVTSTSPSSLPSSGGGKEFLNGHKSASSSDRIERVTNGKDSGYMATTTDLDRGYFSGGEVDSRKSRNVLRKRDSPIHSRNSSYTEEQRHRSATGNYRHSRYGSADSARPQSSVPSGSKRPVSSSGPVARSPTHRAQPVNDESLDPAASPKDAISPALARGVSSSAETKRVTVTTAERRLSTKGSLLAQLQTSKPNPTSRTLGLRAISDAVTGHEKSHAAASPGITSSPLRESPSNSPSLTGSSTPSGSHSKSFETESAEQKNQSSSTTSITSPTSLSGRRKSKKETSAYIRGLERKTPQEQMLDCDYSGWMRKKSSNLMTTWKQRLFVLRGRRLSYYYTDKDDQEKGLIDISSHRVLPANTDRITGLHATLTGVTTSPTSPQHAQTPTAAETDAATEDVLGLPNGGSDSTFIFKLVPPRTGLSKAVNFTKPTVHYFAVDNIKQGRLWMAALMKATIDRDVDQPMVTTYQQKTITLAKARQQRQRPPALMGLDENADEDGSKSTTLDKPEQASVDPPSGDANTAASDTRPSSQNKEPKTLKHAGLGIGTMINEKLAGAEQGKATTLVVTKESGDG
ncbi:MAG: hypothetical protein M1825_000413 [Sarcosagium campestre]|nr:MAG: hypothetical protein M1825_000413 [Sarcosagium campestre]